MTTADTDDRVVPGTASNTPRRCRRRTSGRKPHLIRIETRAGHGSGKPTDKMIEEAADVLAFMAQWTGLKAPEHALQDAAASGPLPHPREGGPSRDPRHRARWGVDRSAQTSVEERMFI